MLWEHKPQASVSTAFSSSPKLSRVFVYIVTRQKHGVHVFYFFQKTTRREKGKQLVNFDYQNVNSLCSRHHYVNSPRQFCISIELYIQTRFLTNQHACFLRTVLIFKSLHRSFPKCRAQGQLSCQSSLMGNCYIDEQLDISQIPAFHINKQIVYNSNSREIFRIPARNLVLYTPY